MVTINGYDVDADAKATTERLTRQTQTDFAGLAITIEGAAGKMASKFPTKGETTAHKRIEAVGNYAKALRKPFGPTKIDGHHTLEVILDKDGKPIEIDEMYVRTRDIAKCGEGNFVTKLGTSTKTLSGPERFISRETGLSLS